MYIHNGQTQPSQLYPMHFLPGDFIGGPSQAVVVMSYRSGKGMVPPDDLRTALNEALGPCESVWDMIADRYDVRHMSTDDLGRMAFELFLAGAISAPEYLRLSSPPSGKSVVADGKRDLRDWVAEYEGLVARCCLRQEQEQFEINVRLLEYLERIDESTQQGRV